MNKFGKRLIKMFVLNKFNYYMKPRN